LTQIYTERIIWVYLGDLWVFDRVSGREIRNPKSEIGELRAESLPSCVAVACSTKETLRQIFDHFPDLTFAIGSVQRDLGRSERLVASTETTPAGEVAGDAAGVAIAISGAQADVKPTVDHSQGHGPSNFFGAQQEIGGLGDHFRRLKMP
jgi:hypothetical protein